MQRRQSETKWKTDEKRVETIMPQDLMQLPKTAEFKIGACHITIEDRKVVDNCGLLGRIMRVISQSNSNRETLYQFEKHGISYEAAIECCAQELKDVPHIFADIIWWYYGFMKIKEICANNGPIEILDFSRVDAARKITDQIIERIRNCNDWGELYDEMYYKSRFQKEIKSKIKKEVLINNAAKPDTTA